MLVVNLFGAPGAGKSTGAAYVFSKLKLEGFNAELVTEFAKDKVWEESKAVFDNQVYIFGKQYFRISKLEGKVDVVVTDSPLLLSSFYSTDELLGDEFNDLVLKIFNHYDSYNAFINRVKDYNPIGRFQTEEESNKVAENLKWFLMCNGVKYTDYNGDIYSYNKLVEDIIKAYESCEYRWEMGRSNSNSISAGNIGLLLETFQNNYET